MFSCQNKVAIVTGGASGIGANIVLEFLKENIKHVAIIDVDVDSGMRLQDSIDVKYGKGKATFYKCDVTNEVQLQEVFCNVIEKYESVDIVVNNAGVADDSPKMYKRTIEINFTALVATTIMALDHMRVDKGGKGGTIINISSITALDPSISAVHIYSSTKAAVIHFSTRLGMDPQYSHTNVRVLTVCFGATDTQIMKKCAGFDYITDGKINEARDILKTQNLLQCSSVAASFIVDIFQKGKSADVWLVQNGEVTDVTDTLKEANANIREIVGFRT
ncbi:15-hydroxyprostaglandin dehydrogenase [NAD(+)]-like [Danaus plexippus]|uniref:15-hydroxyprostaglandin dehydrogenase [NAD(+)]-like n=1 Tax=Danaus plexippus TaxID=13037 RepID=UPI002AB184D0|nr:15-hydroxyprostaglandin dehydrogenase [NAD(+)]-like [Danaus plexippus]